MKYPRSLAVTWQITLEQLSTGEIALLRLLAWFAPDPVLLFVLEGKQAEAHWREGIVLLQQEHPRPADTGGALVDALETLANYSLLRWNTEAQTVAVHRVVQEILRTRLLEAQRKDWLTLSLWLLNAAATGDPQDVRTWPRWDRLRPHVAIGVAQADAVGILEPTGRLMNELGTLLSAKALYAEAEPLIRRALTIGEVAYGPEHLKVAIRLNNLASLLQATNRLAEAEPLIRRVVSILENPGGEPFPNYAGALNNLVGLLKTANRLAEAEPLYRRALAIDEAAHGPEHPDVAIDLNNLAQLLQATNRLTEAELLSRRMVGIFLDFTRRTGHEHPHLRAVLANYAGILKAMGRSKPKIQAQLRALQAKYGVKVE